jgi:Xaa-Pro aminopeptidase
MAVEDGARVDFTRLRQERRARVLAAMEGAGLDVLVLGRSSNVRYVAGARQLWRAGATPFGPACVVIRSTGRVHLLSVWEEGIPPEIAREDLYGMFWNPGNLLEALAKLPGLAEAERIGTDSMTPMFAQALPSAVPKAEFVDGLGVVSGARATKTPDERTCLTLACVLAEAGLTALEATLVPGVTERELLGVLDERLSTLGSTAPASESVAFATPNRGPVRFRHLATERPIGDGELVVLSPGALYAGYEGGLARTVVAGRTVPRGTQELGARAEAGLVALIDACRAGNRGADLYRAWESTGSAPPPVALAHGVGLGVEPPVIGFDRGQDVELLEGMVLSVQSWLSAEGTGGYLRRETVWIGADGPEVLTRGERPET